MGNSVRTRYPYANGPRASSRAVAGFTLIELMIVVAIVAILASIAYASYQSAIVKSRRAAAATCLEERAHFMERWYTTHLSYTGATNPPAQCDGDIKDLYRISFVGAPAGKSFKLQAAPLGAQLAADTTCGTLSIDAKGQRGQSGGGTEADCW